MRLLVFVFFLAAALWASTANAEPKIGDGNGLHAACAADQRRSTPKDFIDASECFGYIIGVADMGAMMGSFCFPDGVTKGQVMDVVTTGLNAHPENRHLSAVGLTAVYLSAAFPCRRTAKQ